MSCAAAALGRMIRAMYVASGLAEHIPLTDPLSPAPRLEPGLAGSVLFHGAVIALLLLAGLLFHPVPPPEPAQPVPVDLVTLADATRAPSAPIVAPAPQQAAPLVAPTPVAPLATPLPAPPVIPPVSRDRDPLAQILPPPKPPAPVAAAPVTEPSTGVSTASATASNAQPGADATIDVRDVIRRQIEQHWKPDLGQLSGRDYVVSIHLSIGRNGEVDSADIVTDPRYLTDPVFHELANSARNAAEVSSPLQVPTALYARFKDLTLVFDPKAMGQ